MANLATLLCRLFYRSGNVELECSRRFLWMQIPLSRKEWTSFTSLSQRGGKIFCLLPTEVCSHRNQCTQDGILETILKGVSMQAEKPGCDQGMVPSDCCGKVVNGTTYHAN